MVQRVQGKFLINSSAFFWWNCTLLKETTCCFCWFLSSTMERVFSSWFLNNTRVGFEHKSCIKENTTYKRAIRVGFHSVKSIPTWNSSKRWKSFMFCANLSNAASMKPPDPSDEAHRKLQKERTCKVKQLLNFLPEFVCVWACRESNAETYHFMVWQALWKCIR